MTTRSRSRRGQSTGRKGGRRSRTSSGGAMDALAGLPGRIRALFIGSWDEMSRRDLTLVDIMTSIMVCIGAWAILWADMDRWGLAVVGVILVVVVAFILRGWHMAGLDIEVWRTLAFSISCAWAATAILLAAWVVNLMPYMGDIILHPMAIAVLIAWAILFAAGIYVYREKTGVDAGGLLEDGFVATMLSVGIGAILVTPTPMWRAINEPGYDPPGMGCCFAWAMSAIFLLPSAVYMRWKMYRKVTRSRRHRGGRTAAGRRR